MAIGAAIYLRIHYIAMNNQPITKQDLSTHESLRVNEIFYSIQGEGPWQGCPAVFIRLAGCNLRCTWCDTKYTENEEMPISSVVDAVRAFPAIKRVVITGGEPFVQDITMLVDTLYQANYSIQIETNGTLSILNFPFDHVTLVCSPKAGRIHADIKDHCVHYKYVIGAEDIGSPDGLPIRPTQQNGKNRPDIYPNLTDYAIVWLMPRDDRRKEQNTTVAAQNAMRFNHRFCLQMHKIIGVR